MKRKIINLSVIMIMAVSLFAVAPLTTDKANAAMSVTKVSSSTVIDSKYSFAPRWISGVTKVEGFGGSSYAEDLWRKNGTTGAVEKLWTTATKYPIRLTSASQKGKVGVWYRNVGEYNGQMLDLKITIMDWTALRSPQTISTSSGNMTSYPSVWFDSSYSIKIDVINGYIKEPKYKFEFYNKSGNPVNVTGHINMLDIDDNQYVQSDDFSKVYVASNTHLTFTGGNKLQAPSSGDIATSDVRGWATALIDNKSSFTYKFSNKNHDSENFSNKRNTRSFYTILMDGDSLARFNTPAPIKSGPGSIQAGNSVSYNVAFTVPQQPSGYLYSKFVMTDTLPSGLTYKSFSVVDDTGANVTSLFTGSVSGQTFTLTAKSPTASSFYFKGYTVTINATSSADFTGKQGSDGKVILKNQVSITAQNTSTPETKTSNAVNTEVLFKIDTKTDGNGSITNSIKGISAGSTKEITFTPNAGYEVDTVTVDGTQVTATDKYVFSDISKNHDISVTFKPTTDNVVTLTKKIPETDVNMANGTPTAIFKLTGTDLNGNNLTYQKVVTLTEDTLKDGHYVVKVKFDNLTAGTYIAAEVDTSRYVLTNVLADKNARTEDNTLVCDLVNGKEASGTFLNGKTILQCFSHNNMKHNSFL